MQTNTATQTSSPAAIWQEIKEVIKEHINIRSFNTWFAPIEIVSLSNDYLEISVPNHFFSEWIETHYQQLIQNAVTQVLGENLKVKYFVDQQEHTSSPYKPSDWKKPSPRLTATREYHSPFFTQINEHYTFDSFIVGDSNNFAYAAARAVADSPGRTNYNPLIIYGGTGLGKTHLIQAIGNQAIKKFPGTKVHYTSSEAFTSHFINSIQQKKVAEFSGYYRSCDILLLDDIHFFSNKGKTQEEFFHTFNDLHQNGKQIILTSDRPINESADLEERLISRFKWGLIVDIQPPDYETRLAILRNKCDENDLDIPGDVLEYLAINLTDNVRELEGALTKIMAQVTFISAEPTLELARSIVSEIAKPDKTMLGIDQIVDHTATIFGIPADQLRAKTRKKDVVKARQVAMYLSKKLTGHSLVTIGLHFGGRDHSTVIHAVDSVAKAIVSDLALRQKVEAMQKHLEYNR